MQNTAAAKRQLPTSGSERPTAHTLTFIHASSNALIKRDRCRLQNAHMTNAQNKRTKQTDDAADAVPSVNHRRRAAIPMCRLHGGVVDAPREHQRTPRWMDVVNHRDRATMTMDAPYMK